MATLLPRSVGVTVSILDHLLVLVLLATNSTNAIRILYADHCNDTVPEAISLATLSTIPPDFFRFSTGHFSGGPSLLDHDPNSSFTISSSFRFNPRRVYGTANPDTVKIEGAFVFYGRSVSFGGEKRGRTLLRFRGVPWVERRKGSVRIKAEGFWSESAGKICMIGEGRGTSVGGNSLNLSAVFTLDYPKRSNVSTSLVYGSLKSLDVVGSVNYFGTIHMLVYAPHDYEYTLVPEAKAMGYGDPGGAVEGVDLGGIGKVCSLLNSIVNLDGLKLEYGDGCELGKCGIFNETVGNLPSFMSMGGIQCSDDGMVHLYLIFSDSNQHGKNSFVEPRSMLMGEGVWDDKRNQLSLVVCRALNYRTSLLDASVGDCTIGVSLWFPRFLSITNRSILSGRIWSNRSLADSSHFQMVSFHDMGDYVGAIPGVRYKFTRLETLRKTCLRFRYRKSTRMNYYDSGYFRNLRFDISVGSANGKFAWGSAIPLSIENTLYNSFFLGAHSMNLTSMRESNSSLWNVSYKIKLYYPNTSLSSKELTDISAEGLHDPETGTLCMVGCHRVLSFDGKKYLKKENLIDCSIAIDIQLHHLHHGMWEHISGTIRSTRRSADPLYFKPLEISSYAMATAQAIWRMDIELVMVLVSLTLACVFTGLQLFHVRKLRHVLPSISLTTLIILSLGYMVPLLVNFEASSLPTRKNNVLLWSGRWLEVNEVLVRIVTMVALLLQLRLLHLTCSARSTGENKKTLQSAERKALLICFLLYAASMLSAWFLHSGSHRYLTPRTRFASSAHSSLWVQLIPYSGLVIDGFLLPQILVNAFSNVKEKSLSPAFHFGITAVRAMPHIYDTYRAQHYIPYLRVPYVYASPDRDMYSTAWNIGIPCGGVLFSFVIYLQQSFGGSCIVPSRLRKPGGYETVPVVCA